jgi:flavorubredoxin
VSTMLDTSAASAVQPYRVADETYVLPWSLMAPPVGFFAMNSMIIRGAEPIILDTGAPACREDWLSAAWEIVDPADVKWVFLSHDDRDHSGNLMQVLEACPNATLVTGWLAVGRMMEEWQIPLPRCRFLNDGETLDVGDRTIAAVRPPVFDNPTTRGLFDSKTGVYWSVDSFACPMPNGPILEADDLTAAEFADGQRLGGQIIAPWHQYLDSTRWQKAVERVVSLPISTLAGCHTPVIRGERISAAVDIVRQLPDVEPWAEFTQTDFEAMLATMPPPESVSIPQQPA